jgi:hypothetical protein
MPLLPRRHLNQQLTTLDLGPHADVGGAVDSGRGHTPIVESRATTPRSEPTLADLGVTKTQSSRWQALAALPKRLMAGSKVARCNFTQAR